MGHCWGSSWARFTDAKKREFCSKRNFLPGLRRFEEEENGRVYISNRF